MGASPSVNATLVDRTPYRLRYLCTSSGQIGTSLLTNRGTLPGATGLIIGGVDLRFNAAQAAERGSLGLPLLEALNTAIANQSQARGLLLGGVTKTVGGSIISHITLRTLVDQEEYWSLDSNEGAAGGDALSAGFGVLLITAPDTAGNQAYLDIHLRRFKTR